LGWLLLGAFLVASNWAQDLPTLFRGERPFEPAGELDRAMLRSWRKQGVKPAKLCSDEVFLRRISLDVIGTLPTSQAVRRFLRDRDPDKRSRRIRELLETGEFADYWSLKWCDLLRVKAEFPINLWPNAVQAYHHWIRWSLDRGMPYDRFVGQLLTSSGSNFRVPQVNFYRAVQSKTPAALASAVALTFMGVRLEKWSPARRQQMEAFFSRVAFKGTAEWKEEIVLLDPAPAKAFQAVFPDGQAVEIAADQDPRMVFARWLTTRENPWFARSLVNRVWSWLLGRGLIHEPDDLRPDNPPSHPEVLEILEREFADSGWNLRHVFQVVLESSTYQQASVPRGAYPMQSFASYPVRRLDAEVMRDAVRSVIGGKEEYSSVIPEPFTFIPGEQRSINLADGSVTSHFLEMFGRPPRDTGRESERSQEPSKDQRLYLLNSSEVIEGIRRSWRIKGLFRRHRGDPQRAVEILYLSLLSRYPRQSELERIDSSLRGRNPRELAEDLVWALLNSKEFLYRH
jgi:hypothetical protein